MPFVFLTLKLQRSLLIFLVLLLQSGDGALLQRNKQITSIQGPIFQTSVWRESQCTFRLAAARAGTGSYLNGIVGHLLQNEFFAGEIEVGLLIGLFAFGVVGSGATPGAIDSKKVVIAPKQTVTVAQ